MASSLLGETGACEDIEDRSNSRQFPIPLWNHKIVLFAGQGNEIEVEMTGHGAGCNAAVRLLGQKPRPAERWLWVITSYPETR